MRNKEFTFDDFYKTPVAYLSKNKTAEEISNIHDKNGLNLLHWAVIKTDKEKVKELVHFNFNLSNLSKKNHIPSIAYIKKQNISQPEKIHLCLNGFTPLHLSLFLFDHYNKNINQNFSFELKAIAQKEIIQIIIENHKSISCTDDCNNSIFDYAFLLENTNIIELIENIDPSFDTLNNVDARTAQKILDTYHLKTLKEFNKKTHDNLSKKILQEELTKKLELNKTVQKNNKTKI